MKFSRIFMLGFLLAVSTPAFSAGKYHCEIKKNGKTFDAPQKEIPDRKTCKAKGGKWVKEHPDHDHSHGADHDHDED